ncbi:MAG: helix-turn-helix transcriptional regulator [Desulfatitalea sp.]|nr:helix-turn-helix transcriptional regulator [Desulfatitalea sp.]NNJ99794.1 helix-turn-helix transcriptional regulator [Desulfatitalea sp.]
MSKLLSTKEVARHLSVNEKMVYALISEKGLPASKVTGKWLFPEYLVDQWVEANTINLPTHREAMPAADGLLIIAGSNDPLLEQAIDLYNSSFPENLAVFGNLGSLGGIRSLKQGRCHMATSHMIQKADDDYNFEIAEQQLQTAPVVVSFCRRNQGLIVAKGNPRHLHAAGDLAQPGLRIVNRGLNTGTRQLFDRELKAAGIKGSQLNGYENEVQRHLDIGLAVLCGRADAGPGIEPVAEQLGLDFIPWRWERYDLLIRKDHFFSPTVQRFLCLLQEKPFQQLGSIYRGYDTQVSGKMRFAHSHDNDIRKTTSLQSEEA